MKFDVFLSICQTEVDGHTPTERKMFENFFDQVRLADDLGFGVAWVAETHLSCQTQKQNQGAVIPEFRGEIGLNTDILQIAHLVFSQTKNISVGSAIRNIQCNGGPIAHAEAVKTFLSLHALQNTDRKLNIGFAAGRFPFSNTPYGISPRDEAEKIAWPIIKNKIFQECTEVFLRLLGGEELSSSEVKPTILKQSDFRDEEMWYEFRRTYHQIFGASGDEMTIANRWNFDKVGVIPFEAPLELLALTIGSHDPQAQILANTFMPTGVFNLSITPSDVVEKTHQRMAEHFHKDGGPWQRHYMPRTCLIFIDESEEKAKQQAEKAWGNYWRAMEGTLDPQKVESAVENAIFGTPERIIESIKKKYHQDDRLMLWFDFNDHDNDAVKAKMKLFMQKVAPELG